MAAAALTWIGLIALLLLGKWWPNPFHPYPGWAAAAPVLATVLIVGGGTAAPRHGVEILLRTPPFKWIGRWSYSIYLWHVPILILAAQRWGPLSGVENLLLCVGAIGLAAATFRWIENPIRHSKRLAQSSAATVAMGVTLVAVSFLVTFLF